MGNSRLTKGGLSPASITNLLNEQQKVDFMFNPQEFTIAKTVNWEEDKEGKVDEPSSQFQSGSIPTISLKLYFDTYETGGDVRIFTDKLWKMTLIEPSTAKPGKYSGNPPPVAFQWGAMYFVAVIQSITVKFTLFSDEGTPRRAEVDLTLAQQKKISQLGARSMPAAAQNTNYEQIPTTTVTEGQRIDQVASEMGLSHRELSSRNGVDNPLKLQNGSVLR
jgi:hypothetical protein